MQIGRLLRHTAALGTILMGALLSGTLAEAQPCTGGSAHLVCAPLGLACSSRTAACSAGFCYCVSTCTVDANCGTVSGSPQFCGANGMCALTNWCNNDTDCASGTNGVCTSDGFCAPCGIRSTAGRAECGPQTTPVTPTLTLLVSETSQTQFVTRQTQPQLVIGGYEVRFGTTPGNNFHPISYHWEADRGQSWQQTRDSGSDGTARFDLEVGRSPGTQFRYEHTIRVTATDSSARSAVGNLNVILGPPTPQLNVTHNRANQRAQQQVETGSGGWISTILVTAYSRAEVQVTEPDGLIGPISYSWSIPNATCRYGFFGRGQIQAALPACAYALLDQSEVSIAIPVMGDPHNTESYGAVPVTVTISDVIGQHVTLSGTASGTEVKLTGFRRSR